MSDTNQGERASLHLVDDPKAPLNQNTYFMRRLHSAYTDQLLPQGFVQVFGMLCSIYDNENDPDTVIRQEEVLASLKSRLHTLIKRYLRKPETNDMGREILSLAEYLLAEQLLKIFLRDESVRELFPEEVKIFSVIE